MSYLAPRLALLRPGNALMAAVGTIVGLLLTGRPDAPSVWFAAPASAFFVAGFGNVINDVFDVELDRVAHPSRPLPAGQIRTREALAFGVLLAALGLLEAFVAGGIVLLAFAAAVLAGLTLYEWRLKALPLVGNLVVASAVGATFVYGALAVGAPTTIVWAVAAMAGLVNLARESWKDIEDVAADRATRRTLAVMSTPAAHGVALLAAILGVALAIPVIHATPSWPLGGHALVGLGAALQLGAAARAVASPAAGQRLLKLGMLIALAGLAWGAMAAASS